MPCIYFISTKLDSKSGQIKGFDVTFRMHSIAKIFDIVKYLRKGKKLKIKKKKKKKKKTGKMAQKGPKWKKGQDFFSGKQFSKKNEKNEQC